MGTCENCIWSYRGEWNFLYCAKLENSSGNDLRVRANGSCDKFSSRATASNSGYNSGSNCFLTSACVKFMGKEDDCYELTILRAFRDNYLKTSEAYQQLIENYYKIAPTIIEHIEASSEPDKHYAYIYKQIQLCITCIEKSDFEQTLFLYKKMVTTLAEEFNL